MKHSTETYTQSVQLQTQLLGLKVCVCVCVWQWNSCVPIWHIASLHFQTEKSLLEKQRDIAIQERDRVVTDAISLKKKLETIKQQRQKDAKELATMRKQRDKATSEHSDSVKHFKMVHLASRDLFRMLCLVDKQSPKLYVHNLRECYNFVSL